MAGYFHQVAVLFAFVLCAEHGMQFVVGQGHAAFHRVVGFSDQLHHPSSTAVVAVIPLPTIKYW
jgi:hypothetical protein